MATILPKGALQAAVEREKSDDGSSVKADIVSTTTIEVPPLAEPRSEDGKRVPWWRRVKHDPDDVATRPSVFDDPVTLEIYRPPPQWENSHRFDPLFRWTWREEKARQYFLPFPHLLTPCMQSVVRKIDFRILIWTWFMFFCLDLDRTNISQANTDNFLQDLHMTTNDFNLGNTLFKVRMHHSALTLGRCSLSI